MSLKILVIESGIKDIEIFKIKVIQDNIDIYYATSFLDVFDLITKDIVSIIFVSDFKGSETTIEYIKMLNNINPKSKVLIHSVNKIITEEIKYYYIQRGADDIISFQDYQGFINKFNYYIINTINKNEDKFNIYTKKILNCIKEKKGNYASIKKMLKNNLNCSDSLIHHYIKNDTGKSLGSCIREDRMNKAENMLINTKLPVKTISMQLGYKSMQGFIKVFKKSKGKSPLKFRKNFYPK